MSDQVEEKKEEAVVNTVDFITNEADTTFKTLEECSEFLASQQRQTHLVDRSQFTDIKLGKSKENKVTIDFGQGEIPLNRTGFSRICKITKSPENYLASLPLENIRKDVVARLLNDSKVKQLNFIIKNGQVTGVATKENTLSSQEFLNHAFQTNHKIFRGIGVANERLVVDFTTNDEHSPLPNDVFGFGVSCIHDDSSGNFPTLSPYSYRLVCANGAVHMKTLGSIRFGARMSADKVFEVMQQRFVELPNQLSTKYHDVLQTMNTTVISPEEKQFIRSFLEDEFSWSDSIDGSTQFDEAITNKESANYYDLLNVITSYANQLDIRTRREIQMLAGRMFDYFDHSSSELFKGYSEFKRMKTLELASK